jgi:hypothetical protein
VRRCLGRRALLCGTLLLGAVTPACSLGPDEQRVPGLNRVRRASIFYSAIAARDEPDIVRRFYAPRDYVRSDALPKGLDVARRRRYALPTSLRVRWEGFYGVRHWVRLGCGPSTPGTILYDPEERSLTPRPEQRDFPGSVRRAARLVNDTGCHDFGIAPGATLLFGFDPDACSHDLEQAPLGRLPWRQIDILDIQSQRLLSDHCWRHGGLETYRAVVDAIARFVRARNPSISVLAQVSFRYSPPQRMHTALAGVADEIDGFYFSYPTTSPTPCRYCSVSNLTAFLEPLRGNDVGRGPGRRKPSRAGMAQ